jgi:hypothetical protein
MRADQLSRQWRVTRAIKADPITFPPDSFHPPIVSDRKTRKRILGDSLCPGEREPTDSPVPVERIQKLIFLTRGQKVMLDRDLAKLYGVETRVLNQAVRRNRYRFPDDFMFSLTREEITNLSQIVTSSGIKHAPNVFAFTEQGVAMLSSVLNSAFRPRRLGVRGKRNQGRFLENLCFSYPPQRR